MRLYFEVAKPFEFGMKDWYSIGKKGGTKCFWDTQPSSFTWWWPRWSSATTARTISKSFEPSNNDIFVKLGHIPVTAVMSDWTERNTKIYFAASSEKYTLHMNVQIVGFKRVVHEPFSTTAENNIKILFSVKAINFLNIFLFKTSLFEHTFHKSRDPYFLVLMLIVTFVM